MVANDTVTYLPNIGEKYLPNYAIYCFIALAAVCFAIEILGFIGGVTESKAVVEAYMIMLFFSFVLMIVYAALLSYYSMRFYDYFEDNWGSVMLYVNKEFYSTTMMNCYGGKYY